MKLIYRVLLFLIIDIYFLIPDNIMPIFNPTIKLVIYKERKITQETKADNEAKITVETKISKC